MIEHEGGTELLLMFVEQSYELLDKAERAVLELERGLEPEVVNEIFRTFHTVKGDATVFGLSTIKEFAHKLEDVLSLVREGRLVPSKEHFNLFLDGIDGLRRMIGGIESAKEISVDGVMARVTALLDAAQSPGKPTESARPAGDFVAGSASPAGVIVVPPKKKKPDAEKKADKAPAPPDLPVKPDGTVKALLVEDEFLGRMLLQQHLAKFGFEPHIAVNGYEAVGAFGMALESGEPYSLVCLDIMMPDMDGLTALQKIRELEEKRGVISSRGARIIMTTSLSDPANVRTAYGSLCDGYLVKPISRDSIEAELRRLGLVP